MHRRFSIRYKFLLATTILLVVCVGVYLAIATYVFKTDKTALVYDYNRSIVSNLSSELDSFFNGLSDKLKLAAYFYRTPGHKNRQVINDLLRSNDNIVFISSSLDYKNTDKTYFVNESFKETYSLGKNFFAKEISKEVPIPLDQIRVEGEAIWNATTKSGPALIGYGKSVVEEDRKGRPVNQFAVISYIRLDKIHSSLGLSAGDQALAEVYAVNQNGELLLHSDANRLRDRVAPNQDLFQKAFKNPMRLAVTEFEAGDESFLGAYSKTYNSRIYIFSVASTSKAFRAVNDLVRQSIIFAAIVLTLSFIFAILFSRSLTKPIDKLVGGMRNVADGDLDTHIDIHTKDEIASLANSFNSMIHDLKQSRQELVAINRDLEDKVRERTKKLEEQNLAVKEAQEALLKSTRLAAVGEVAGQAAHEVLNPLTSIINRAQRLNDRLQTQLQGETELLSEISDGWKSDYKEGGFDKLVTSWKNPSTVKEGSSLWDEDMENLQHIRSKLQSEVKQMITDTDFVLQESQRINRIVNTMRSMSRAKKSLRNHSGHKLLKRTLNIMADMALKYDIKLVMDNSASGDLICLDEDEFLQVMTNLLRNSIQAIVMKENAEARTVRVSTHSSVEFFEIRIADTGVGISEENKAKLFKRNFSTKSKDEGTGIGLAISRRLIRSVKGDLTLEKSKPGEGAVFLLTVPLLDSGSEDERKTA